MDNLFDSVENEKKEVELYHQLNEICGEASMQARKWISNSLTAIVAITEEDRITDITINNNQFPVTRNLGVSWTSSEVTFTITVSSNFQITKRNILKKIATIFDPLGLGSPVIIAAKILIQELWSRG